ncbi:MAG: translation elongation factor 4 [Planctomycetes bacterium]|nr:translation elongation factor 4 [Planctomycetota bacterium]
MTNGTQVEIPQDRIRNFCIIAHIDHGKSTLADRFLLRTDTISEREFTNQMLDDMDLEKERGITIKAKAVTMRYVAEDGLAYRFNLIDTPGHVDFCYEVSRSLAACEGALLVVDASQGVEAQTVANTYLAREQGLEIIPVINKVDLAVARPEAVEKEMTSTFGFYAGEALRCSARSGAGVQEILEAIVHLVPAPSGSRDAPLRALIFDSHYDEFRGVIVYVSVKEGVLNTGDQILLMSGQHRYQVDEVGFFTPRMTPHARLQAGEVGYLIANIKGIHDIKIGDTVTLRSGAASDALPGFDNPQPMVFCGIYPTDNSQFEELRDALDKLWLNDSSFTRGPETSEALGFGFRCGFLGLLHMEIVQERIERESGVEVVQTAPTVTYEVLLNRGEIVTISAPADLPDPSITAEIREPIVQARIVLPTEYIGSIMKIMGEKRGTFLTTNYLSPARAQLLYEVPLAEIIIDFYDKLKSTTRGYGTLDYSMTGYRPGDLVKLNILVNGEPVDALSMIVHRSVAERRGRALLKKLKEVIPMHLFQIPLQAAIGGRIVARETIRAMAKNVTAKCYGGDITRKRKLLEKQKEGKRRMKQVGSVEIPQDAFLAVLRLEEEEKR